MWGKVSRWQEPFWWFPRLLNGSDPGVARIYSAVIIALQCLSALSPQIDASELFHWHLHETRTLEVLGAVSPADGSRSPCAAALLGDEAPVVLLSPPVSTDGGGSVTSTSLLFSWWRLSHFGANIPLVFFLSNTSSWDQWSFWLLLVSVCSLHNLIRLWLGNVKSFKITQTDVFWGHVVVW